MAKAPTGHGELPPITQKVILEVQEILNKDAKKVVDLLSDLSKAADKATASLDKTAKSLSNIEKAGVGFGKVMKGLGGAIGKGFSFVGGLIKDAALALGGFTSDVISSQKTYLDFITTVAGGSKALEDLRVAYDNATKASGSSLISMREVSKVLTDLAKKGAAQAILAGTKDTMEGVTKMTTELTKRLGVAGTDMAKALIDALGDNLPAMQSMLNLDFTKSREGVAKLQTMLMGLGQTALAVRLDAFKDDVDGAVKPITTMGQLTSRLATTWQNLQDAIAKAIGPIVAKWLGSIDDWLKNLTDSSSGWTKAVQTIAMGAQKLFEIWTRGLSFVWKTLQQVGSYLSKAFNLSDQEDGFTKFFGVLIYGYNNLLTTSLIVWNKIKEAALLSIGAIVKAAGHAKQFFGFSDDILQIGQKMTADAEAAGKEASRLKDDYISLERAIANLKKSQEDLNNVKPPDPKPLTEQEKRLEELSRRYREMALELAKIAPYTQALSEMTDTLDTLGQMAEYAGGNFEIAGQSVADMIEQLSKPIGEMAFGKMSQATDEAIKKQRELLDIERTRYQEMLAIAEERKKEGKLTDADTAALNTQQQVVAKQAATVKELTQTRIKGLQAVNALLQASLKPYEAQLSLISRQRALQESTLKISQQLYGTPALAVENQLKVIDLIQKEKEQIVGKLNATRAVIQRMKAEGASEEALLKARQQELDLQKELADKTADQLGMVKQLRDGYLDAVQAQAFGAGRFEKIIITQEKNLMRGLQNRIVKESYLLGQYKKEGETLESIRYTAEGMGTMATGGGMGVDEEEVKRRQGIIQGRIPERDQRVMSAAAKVTQNAQVQAATQITTSQEKQTDRVVGKLDEIRDEIYQGARRAAPGAAMAGGGPAATTGMGAAAKAALGGGRTERAGAMPWLQAYDWSAIQNAGAKGRTAAMKRAEEIYGKDKVKEIVKAQEDYERKSARARTLAKKVAGIRTIKGLHGFGETMTPEQKKMLKESEKAQYEAEAARKKLEKTQQGATATPEYQAKMAKIAAAKKAQDEADAQAKQQFLGGGVVATGGATPAGTVATPKTNIITNSDSILGLCKQFVDNLASQQQIMMLIGGQIQKFINANDTSPTPSANLTDRTVGVEAYIAH